MSQEYCLLLVQIISCFLCRASHTSFIVVIEDTPSRGGGSARGHMIFSFSFPFLKSCLLRFTDGPARPRDVEEETAWCCVLGSLAGV